MGNSKYFFLILLLFLVTFVHSMGAENTFCCERTHSGATCQNIKESNVATECDSNGGITETSCASTSFCRVGTCIDSVRGSCISSPKITCEDSGGIFLDQSMRNVAACQKGCCLLGSRNAMFVSASECSYIATSLGSKFEFNPSIHDQFECLSLKNTDELGACVATNSIGMKTCRLKTRADCDGVEGVIGKDELDSTIFYAGYLCSSSELATNCTRQYSTNCDRLSGMETLDVYWVDSCGNRENIVANFNEKGGDSLSHNGGKIITNYSSFSRTFDGDCDYYLGTQCSILSEEDESTKGKELYGKYSNVLHYCKSTSCVVNGIEKKNGESWCETDKNAVNNPLISDSGKLFTNKSIGNGLDLVGQEYYLYKCVQGNVIKENCDVKRKQICISSSQKVDWDGAEIYYSTARCIANAYPDCMAQTSEYDCLNTYQRYCRWISSSEINLLKSTESKINLYNTVIDFGSSKYGGVCLPMYSIGDDSSTTCSGVQITCEVEYERNLWMGLKNWFRSWGGKSRDDFEDAGFSITGNVDCINNSLWVEQANSICVSAGDCGFYANIIKNISTQDRNGYKHTGQYYDEVYSPKGTYATLQSWVNTQLGGGGI